MDEISLGDLTSFLRSLLPVVLRMPDLGRLVFPVCSDLVSPEPYQENG